MYQTWSRKLTRRRLFVSVVGSLIGQPQTRPARTEIMRCQRQRQRQRQRPLRNFIASYASSTSAIKLE